MALVTLVALGVVSAIVLWLLRENRHRWRKPDYPDPAGDEVKRR